MEVRSAAGAAARRRRLRRSPLVPAAAVIVVIGAALAVPTGLAARVARVVSGGAVAVDLDGPLPACRADEILATHREPGDWARTLLDPMFRLDAGARPADLVPVGEAGIPGNGTVRLLVVDDLRAMTRAARADGVRLRVRSAFRSDDDQARTFDSLVREHGAAWAALSAARPGHSEHQLGTALDLDGGDAWLAANAWRHGFVVSYPSDRSPAFTCYKPEPWHVRYVGRPAARAIHESGLSLREWLWLHAEDGTA
jgi:D-alanyl-D-alanine carboxypeptidase